MLPQPFVLRAVRALTPIGWKSDLDVVVDRTSGTIIEIGPGVGGGAAGVEVDTLVPGFIDVHSMEVGPQTVAGKDGSNLLAQGVTTIVTGNCGVGYPELKDVGDLPVNVLPLIGHNAVSARIGSTRTAAEVIDAMTAGMRVGTGASLGLMYEPGRSASASELEDIAHLVAQRSGTLTVHMRDEAAGLRNSIEECIALAAYCTVVVMHLKACGHRHWNALPELRGMLEAAQIPFTYYPYTDTNTRLDACYPGDRYRLEVDGLQNLARDGWSGVVLTGNCPDQLIGLSVNRIGLLRGMTDVQAFESILRDFPDARVRFIEVAEEAQLRESARSPLAMPASDAYVFSIADQIAEHPRNYGAIARSLRWAREGGYTDHVIRNLTALPASVYGISSRGSLEPGNRADLVALSVEDIDDLATYESPTRLAQGVSQVWIGGRLAFRHGEAVDPTLGVVL